MECTSDYNEIDLLKSITGSYQDVAGVMITSEHNPDLKHTDARFGVDGSIHEPLSLDHLFGALKNATPSR
jgi:hypothetical protein